MADQLYDVNGSPVDAPHESFGSRFMPYAAGAYMASPLVKSLARGAARLGGLALRGVVNPASALAAGAYGTYNAMNHINGGLADQNMMLDPEMGPMALPPSPGAPAAPVAPAAPAAQAAPQSPLNNRVLFNPANVGGAPHGFGAQPPLPPSFPVVPDPPQANPVLAQALKKAIASSPPAAPQAAPQAQPLNPFFSGPGSMSFGAGDGPSGNQYGSPAMGTPDANSGPDLIQKFLSYFHQAGPGPGQG